MSGLDLGDGALGEINVEPQEVMVFDRLKFHRVAKEVVVKEGLYCWM